MKISKLCGPFLAALITGVISQNTTNVTAINVDGFPNSTLEATAWALIYTYPLQIFANFVGNVLCNGSTNEIFHQRNLASPDNPGVIKPNVDTLYSRVVLDLSQQDVVLTVPNVTDGRYYVFPVLDAFGNVMAEIGAVNENKPGDYLIRRASDVSVQPGFDNSTTPNSSTRYQGFVNLPTTYGTMLIRFLVKSNTTEDLDTLHAYQDASRLTPVNRTIPAWATSPAPLLTTLSLNGSFLGIQTPSHQLEFAARLIPHNQPENYTERHRVASILALAGLYNHGYHPPPTNPSVNLTLASTIANTSITAFIDDPQNLRPQGNTWELSTPSTQGNYGPAYASAAYVALAGYQQQTVRQTLYPGYGGTLGFTTTFHLPPQTSVLVTFSGKPALHPATGFWSLTVYGVDQYLVPNPLGRFSVGDRDFGLVYADDGDDNGGRPVYGPQADTSRDGVFQVLVQPVGVVPPANWTANWLPCTTEFSWILRWYVPEDAMTNGTYVYPRVELIPSITEASSTSTSVMVTQTS